MYWGGVGDSGGMIVATAWKRLIWAAAGAAAALSFAVPSSHAGTIGNAPWCAVVNQGMGDMVWDCEYWTEQQCVPNVLAGNRGFCNINPYYPGRYSATPPGPPPGAMAHRRVKHRRHHASH